MLGLRKAVAAGQSFRQRFEGRLDSEHEQAFIRLVIGTLVCLYFLVIALQSDQQTQSSALSFVGVMMGFIAASFGLILHIASHPRVFPLRRLLAAALDSGAVTYFFFNAAE